MFLLAAISLGFLGSFHCIGMCGPIALAIPVKRGSALSMITGSFIYNFGRMITYAILGMLFGLIGQGISFAGWQNALSIALGIFILIMLLFPKLSLLSGNFGLVLRALEKIKSSIRTLFGIHNMGSLMLIGILNGLLPCGLVYLGIAGAMATGNSFDGALFMAAFGLGTFPAMVALTLVRNYISIRFRERIRSAVPVFVGAMAIILILRGMNLGIPYISPAVKTTGSGSCHHHCCEAK